MKLLNIWVFVFSILSFVLGLKIEDSSQAHLDVFVKGATCAPVYSNGNDSYILVKLENLKYEGRVTDTENTQFPVAIFKYANIAYYDDFDTLDEFEELYSDEVLFRISQHEHLLDFDTNDIINLHLFNLIGLPSMFLGDLLQNYDFDKAKIATINLKIEKSGIYCVYMVPPPDIAFQETTSVKVTYINSYGYLRYQDYLKYRSCIISTIIGTITFIVMYYYYKFKCPKPYTEIGDFSRLYRVILFYCLLPLMMINSLRIIPYYIGNNIFPDEELQSFFDLLLELIGFLRYFLMKFTFNYLPVLFALGYGVFYNGSESKNGQKIGWKRGAKVILFFDILFTMIKLSIRVSLFRLMIFRTLWLSIYLLGYRQTMRNVKSSNLEDSEIKDHLIGSFQTSFWAISFGRVIINKILSLLLLIQYHIQFDRLDYKMKLNVLGYRNADEVYDSLEQEFSIFKEFPKNNWPYDLEYYIILIIVFFVWFRTSKAISKKSTPKEPEKELSIK